MFQMVFSFVPRSSHYRYGLSLTWISTALCGIDITITTLVVEYTTKRLMSLSFGVFPFAVEIGARGYFFIRLDLDSILDDNLRLEKDIKDALLELVLKRGMRFTHSS